VPSTSRAAGTSTSGCSAPRQAILTSSRRPPASRPHIRIRTHIRSSPSIARHSPPNWSSSPGHSGKGCGLCSLGRSRLIGNMISKMYSCIYRNPLIQLAVSRSYRPLLAFRHLKSASASRFRQLRQISASNRFCPQWRRLSGAGSAPDLSFNSAPFMAT